MSDNTSHKGPNDFRRLIWHWINAPIVATLFGVVLSLALIQPAVPEQMISPADIYFYRGNAYANKGDFDHAVADFSKAIILEPDLAQAYNNRGIIYTNKGDKDNAIDDLKKILELTDDPNVRQRARQQLQKLGVE